MLTRSNVDARTGQLGLASELDGLVKDGKDSVWRTRRRRFLLSCLLAMSVLSGGFNLTSAQTVRLAVNSVSASADDGNVAANTVDGSLSTRWSAQGDGQWIRFELAMSRTIGSVKIAWHNGDLRRAIFDLQTSADGTSWTTVFSGQSSGASS